MKTILAAFSFLLASMGAAAAQEIVTDLSQSEIELTYSFKGQDLFLFGTVKGGETLPPGDLDVVVTITGLAHPHLVMKKERVIGFWINASSRKLDAVPDFYGQASTRPLEKIAASDVLQNAGLGVQQLAFVRDLKNEGETGREFADGVIRVREKEGLFQTGTADMSVMSGVLFRADFFFPPRVPSGTYRATAYLFKNGQLIGKETRPIEVDQVGFERTVYLLANDHPYLYGLLAVLIALGAGWLAGFVTRKRQKIG